MATSTNPTRSAEQGATFRSAREGAGLPIRSLASRAGIDHSSISRWERGERDISEATYQHLPLALADYIAGRWAA